MTDQEIVELFRKELTDQVDEWIQEDYIDGDNVDTVRHLLAGPLSDLAIVARDYLAWDVDSFLMSCCIDCEDGMHGKDLTPDDYDTLTRLNGGVAFDLNPNRWDT